MGRVFANGPGDLVSIPGRIIPKTLKMVLDTSLLNTQQYKVRIKSEVEQSRERSIALHLCVVAIEKGAFWSPSITVASFTTFIMVLTVSLGRPLAKIIYSIFPLSNESNALEKFSNNPVASVFFLFFCTNN